VLPMLGKISDVNGDHEQILEPVDH
jgi:hypothetical protein